MLGLGFAIPAVNWLTMIGLSLLPSAPEPHWAVETPGGTARNLKGALIGMVLAIAIGLASMAAVVQTDRRLRSDAVLRHAADDGHGDRPAHESPGAAPLSDSILTTLLAILLTGGALALFALEGVICLLMAAPIAVVAALMGAVVGRAIASHGRHRIAPVILAAATVPLLGMAEHAIEQPTLHEVLSVQDIDSPPDVVWQHVIAFADMPPPTEWVFGRVSPIQCVPGWRAPASRGPVLRVFDGRLRGAHHRVGPGRRLAFDVAAQPPPMHEWGLAGALHPPHLDTLLRSRRGEFRLIARADGGTRLEVVTWTSCVHRPR